jgi:Glycosyl transferase family 11/Glycosyl transferases group 1
MKRLIQLPRWEELKPLPVMECVFNELIDGFIDYNCKVKIVSSLEDLEDGGIIFLDNTTTNYLDLKEVYIKMGQKCPNSIFICWYWDKDNSFKPFQYMIHTGEYYIKKNNDCFGHSSYMMRSDFIPLKLRASESPEKIGTYPRNIVRDYCYMGGGYKMDWIPSEFNGIYHRVIYNNYLSYSERRNIYLSSTFAFGFQSDGNITVGHLSQRIFEGLAYGCIVLCENKLASEFTDGAVIHITSKQDLIDKMNYYKQYPDEIEKIQKKGYEWVKKYGTNRLTIQNLLDKIYSLFRQTFEPLSIKLSSEFKENNEVEEEKYFNLPNMSNRIVSIDIMGGLGNQLFQIAAAYAYAMKENAQLQILYKSNNGNRPVYWDTVLKKLKSYFVSSLPSLPIWSEDLPTMYKPIDPIISNGIHLKGYLQSSKYYYHPTIIQQIKQLFRPDKSSLENITKKYRYLLNERERVVIIHARRTDYITHSEFHGPLDISYYKEAVNRMLQKVEDPIYILAADDSNYWSEIKEYIPEVFSNPHIIIDNESDIDTFYLLQQFQHFIMSNSTFIWWCVYLADAQNVFAPSKWFGPHGPQPFHDIFESNWNLI